MIPLTQKDYFFTQAGHLDYDKERGTFIGFLGDKKGNAFRFDVSDTHANFEIDHRYSQLQDVRNQLHMYQQQVAEIALLADDDFSDVMILFENYHDHTLQLDDGKVIVDRTHYCEFALTTTNKTFQLCTFFNGEQTLNYGKLQDVEEYLGEEAMLQLWKVMAEKSRYAVVLGLFEVKKEEKRPFFDDPFN